MESREKEIYRVTLAGSGINALLIVLKFIAGIAGHSSALVADAIHSLSDFVTDVIVLVFVHISGKPRDRDHAYGHGKFETMATLIIGVILFAVGIGVFINGMRLVIDSLRGAVLPKPGMLALVIAAVSIVLKEGLYHYTLAKGEKLISQAVIANAWHHRSDALSSVGTLIGIAGAIFLGERWRILDPLAAVAVSFFIMKVACSIARPCVDELLEKSLPRETENEILQTISSVPGVSAPHNLRTRRIGNNIAVEIHLHMDGSVTLAEAHARATEVERRLRERFGQGTHVAVHMEPSHTV